MQEIFSGFLKQGGCLIRLLNASGGGGGGISECPGNSIFIFFIKENWNCGMNRYNAEPNINLLLTGNVPLTMMLDNEVIL